MTVPFELGHDRVEAVVVAEELVGVVDVVMSDDVVFRYELEFDDGDVILVAGVEDKIGELPGEEDGELELEVMLDITVLELVE